MVIFLLSFIFYVFNLAPSITVGDAGELITSCKILGINHAPGYPLFSLLGKISLTLIPFGDVAYRINLLSALLGSATVFLVYKILKQRVYSFEVEFKILPFITSFVFALSFSFVRSSIQTEVFTLNSLFAAFIVLLVISEIIRKTKTDIRYLYLISFIFGLGLGNHHTLVLLVPSVVYIVYQYRQNLKTFNPFALKYLSAYALFFCIGFSVYFYLPVRAQKEPGFNVGNPATLDRVIRVIRRADYGTFKLTVGEKEKYDLKTVFRQTKRALKGVVHQFSVVGLIVAILGVYYMTKKHRLFAVFVFLVYFFTVPFFIYLGNIPFNAEAEGILERFYVMGNIPLVVMIFYGAQALHSILKSKVFTVIVLFVVVFLILKDNILSYNWRNYFLAYDYGKNLLKTIAPGSVFFMDGGDDTFYSMGYFVFAKKLRSDIELYDRGGVVFKSPYGDDFRKLSRSEKEIRRKKVESEISKTKPVYFSTFNKEIMSPQKVSQVGILYAPNVRIVNLFPLYSLRNLFDDFTDYRSRALQPLYFYLEGLLFSEPLRYLRYCIKRWPDVLWMMTNIKIELTHLAYQKFNEQKYAEAKSIYETILESVDSQDVSAMVNLGVICEKSGNEEEALEYYRKASELDPTYVMAYYNSAVIYWKRNDWQNVVLYFKKVLEYEPQNEQARRYLHIAQQNLVKNR